MSYLTEPEAKKLKITNEVNITPPGDLILSYLGIDRATVKSIKPLTKRTQYRAVINWLTKNYQPRNDSNIEKLRCYLEAFHHLCEIEVWGKASEILLVHLNTPTKEKLHNQLYTWGYYREPLDLYNRILHKIDSRLDAIIFNNSGNSYLTFGDLSKAIEYYHQSLTIAQQIGDYLLESQCLGNLGLAHRGIGDSGKAIDYYQRSLAIAQHIENRQQEAGCLRSLGEAYLDLMNYKQAGSCLEQALNLAQEVNNLQEEGQTLGNLGRLYLGLAE